MSTSNSKITPEKYDGDVEMVSSIKPSKKDFDVLLEQLLGKFGRYQMIQYFLICIPSLFAAMHVMSWTFASSSSESLCANDTAVENCTQIRFSAADRWEMKGDRSWIKGTVQACYYFGHMTGSLFCGMMSDRYGRKRVLYFAIILQISCSTVMIMAPTWWIFAVFKFGTGVSHPGVYAVAIVLGTEVVGRKYRGIVSVGTATFIALGELLLVLMAYLIFDYRILQSAIVLPSICLLSYWWLVPESIRWLAVKGRFDEADKIVKRAAKINGLPCPRRWWKELQTDPSDENATYSPLELFRIPMLRRRTLVSFFIWPISAMLYYGLTMKSDLGGGSLWLNFAISASAEIPAVLIVYLLIDKVGRRGIVASTMLMAGISLLAMSFLDETGQAVILCQLAAPFDEQIFRAFGFLVPSYCGTMLVLTAKSAVTATLTSVYTYTSEMFPTVIRNTAVGCCSTMARLGAVVSSYMALWLVDAYGKLSMIIPFSALSLLAAILTMVFLPETMGKAMPETISDVEQT